jgi:hypothetical protein
MLNVLNVKGAFFYAIQLFLIITTLRCNPLHNMKGMKPYYYSYVYDKNIHTKN